MKGGKCQYLVEEGWIEEGFLRNSMLQRFARVETRREEGAMGDCSVMMYELSARNAARISVWVFIRAKIRETGKCAGYGICRGWSFRLDQRAAWLI